MQKWIVIYKIGTSKATIRVPGKDAADAARRTVGLAVLMRKPSRLEILSVDEDNG